MQKSLESSHQSLSFPRISDFMETQLSTLAFVVLGLVFNFCAFLVDSQPPKDPGSTFVASPSQPAPPPPPPRLPPPPSPSPVLPPLAPSRFSSSLPPHTPPPLPSSPPPRISPPPTHPRNSPPATSANRFHNKYGARKRHPPPPPQHRMNKGKKIGLLFAGIAAILQIGVVGFLVFKRRQLLRIKDRYGTCSA